MSTSTGTRSFRWTARAPNTVVRWRRRWTGLWAGSMATGRSFTAIEEGKAEVSRDGRKIAKLTDGDIFGEAGMLDDAQRNATVTAKSRVRLISLGHFEVKRLKRDAPGVYAAIEKLVEPRAVLPVLACRQQ
jgi:CRP-like cAMP-binding protein